VSTGLQQASKFLASLDLVLARKVINTRNTRIGLRAIFPSMRKTDPGLLHTVGDHSIALSRKTRVCLYVDGC